MTSATRANRSLRPTVALRSMRHAAPSTLAAAVAAVLAATSTHAAPAADSEVAPLQEIVVTSRKRTESLQDVPASIDVLTAKDLQALGIASFDDYAQKVPSISFISVGPGTQLFVMRGVSDGSNPNYANSSATGLFLDDASLSLSGVQPDLHLYDMERIEVLNGPQGTTFGAGSMAGAIRYITNKPDPNAFDAGVDFDGGKIQGGQQNWTYEGFVNLPLIDGVLAARFSAFSASHGGFIDNRLTTRDWLNGTVSDNSAWAGNNYNRQHEEGGRAALKYIMNDRWSATLSYTYQRQTTRGAWDEDLANVGPRAVSRFGPEGRFFQSKIAQLHVDGDVGIGDLVFASTYWSLPTRQQNEYSQYMQNYKGGAQQGFTCLDDPTYGGGEFTGCNVPSQFFEYHTNPERWSQELRLASKPGRFHYLAGLYWERTRDKNAGSTYYMPGLQTEGAAFQSYLSYYNTTASSLPPGQWYGYHERSDYLQSTEFANIGFDLTEKFTVEVGAVHFKSHFSYRYDYGQFAYAPTTPVSANGSSSKWNTKADASYKITDKVMVYAEFAQGFRDGGVNAGLPQNCYAAGVPDKYIPDTLNSYEVGWKSLNFDRRLLFNGAAYVMNWHDLQTLIYDVDLCAPSSFNANVGKARIYGAESNVEFKITDHWTIQSAGSYTDSHLVSSAYPTFEGNVGERLPFVPYFSYSANLRYERPIWAGLKGHGQIDVSHKGNMWDDLHVAGANGFPRILQPQYTLANLRFGLQSQTGRWSAEFYITNLADKNAIIFSNTGNFDLRQTTNEPRVFGLRLSYRLGKSAAKDKE